MSTPAYDEIGATYTSTRRPDPRIEARIHAALGDARTVVNVGAGSGSYEPPATLLAVEPSPVMIAQRPPGSAPAVRACAEALPLADGAADATMALLTVHHWADVEAGIGELLRVSRRRVVVFTRDQQVTRENFWLVRDYLADVAAFDDAHNVPVDRLVSLLGGRARVEPVPVPYDCQDGFGAAFWRRPHAYLDPVVRAGISMLAQSGEQEIAPGMNRLSADLASGRWRVRYAGLLDHDELDCGYRLVTVELG